MNYQTLFYLIAVADNAKEFFLVASVVFSAVVGLSIATYAICVISEDYPNTEKASKSWIKYCTPFMILFWALLIFTPTKKDALLIVAGGGALNYLSSDSSAKAIPHELLNFAKTELQNLAESSKVDLGIKSAKDKILEEAKSMTSQQIIDRIKIDSNFAKIVLDK